MGPRKFTPPNPFHINDEDVSEALDRQIEEGTTRLSRPFTALVATGVMGSLEIGVGLLAQYTVYSATGSDMLGALGFTVGLVIILMAHSELFTEGFLVPVTAVVAGSAKPIRLPIFWAATFLGNVIGAAIIMGLLTVGYPEMHPYLIEEATHYATMSLDAEHLVKAALGGMILTLVTRMHQSTMDMTPKIVASAIGGFLLAATGIIHSILDTLYIFGGIFAGAPGINFGSWLAFVWWVAVANLIGGLVLVTSIRYVRAHNLAGNKDD